jgi:hypothetical protein
MVDVLMSVGRDVRLTLLDGDHLNSTALTGIRTVQPDALAQAADALRLVLADWLTGEPLTSVGARLHAQTEPVKVSRASGDPLPRTLRFTRDGIEHRLTSLAGALVAIVLTGAEEDPEGPWQIPPVALAALGRLPVAIRIGAADPAVLALARAGVRPRVVAHLLARLNAPAEDVEEQHYGFWASRVVNRLADFEFVEGLTGDPAERAVLAAAAHRLTFA